MDDLHGLAEALDDLAGRLGITAVWVERDADPAEADPRRRPDPARRTADDPR